MSSKKFLANSITLSPLSGLYPPSLWAPSFSLIMSVPYKASYKLPHLALAAFNANLAFMTGTTNCGPAIVLISGSTFDVVIENFGLLGAR